MKNTSKEKELTTVYYTVYDNEDNYPDNSCLDVFDTEDEAREYVNSENAGYSYTKLYYTVNEI